MKIKEGKDDSYQKWIDSNRDSYGGAVIDYARRWAAMMEKELENGKNFAKAAESTEHEADTEGITGFMYGAAVAFLVDVWKYGEDLRRWHNKEYHYDGDGVANPAIITINC